jgi:hypothetical protein
MQGSAQSPVSDLPAPPPVTTLQPDMVCLVYPDGRVIVCTHGELERYPE